MNRSETLNCILDTGVVAVIRMKDAARLSKVVEAISVGGIKCIEITMSVPGAVDVISHLIKVMPKDIIIGAGTVTDIDNAKTVLKTGAKFVVSPILNLDIVKACIDNDTVCVPGCFTPTEILAGWQAGADIIKVFPATSLGPRYFKDLAGPFPKIRLMPTGGVTVDNVADWVKAGAVAVGIGSDLLNNLVDEERYEDLTERASRMVKNFRDAKK